MTKTATQTWDTLHAVAATHGPSFYLADLERFEANYRSFLGAFKAIYPNTRVAYSYKTNYLPAFILRAQALGAFAEVVSRFEFGYALALGTPGEHIIINGPSKPTEELAHAFNVGATVNADSVPEIWQMMEVAGRLGGPFPVGIRCYLPDEDLVSRFGVDLRHPEGVAALRALDATPNLRLAGLHCHHSGDRSAERYRRRTQALIALHREVLEERPLDFIDIGGGFASNMHPDLAVQLGPSATYEDYAQAVAGEMVEAYGTGGPELLLEPGMSLLADTMTFVTRVETVKEQHRQLAVVDGSVFNIQPPWNLRQSINLPIRVVSATHGRGQKEGPWDVVGHTCIEADTLHRGYAGALRVGDYIVIENVGAYTNVLNAPFIQGTPPILALDGEGAEQILRPASTVDDLLRSYEAPS